MKTINNIHLRLIAILIFAGLSNIVLADGLLLPEDESYPADFLRNKITEVHVTINGLIAQTVIYQEFVNEWDQPVDAVYNFPVPADARTTQLLYTRNDTTFKAILRVEPEDPNPGTGQGGIAALVNDYIKPNGLKLSLKDIPAGGIQSITLTYISLLEYHLGECKYEYPLATSDFITYPIDHLEFTFDVNAEREITQFDIPTHPGFQVLEDDSTYLKLRLRQPMAFLATDLEFVLNVENPDHSIDFYPVDNDTVDGHFSLFVRAENYALPADVLSKKIVFLLGNSSSMIGYKLEQSIEAISNSLDLLSPNDYFNIVLFNYYVESWSDILVPANSTNVNSAKAYLADVTGTGGSRLDLGIDYALQQFEDNDYNNAIMAFTDGMSPLDPEEVASNNIYETGIFPIGIGEDVDRYRLDMTASLNYGFSNYFDEEDNLRDGIYRVFEKIHQPVLKNVDLDFNKPDVYNINPEVYPSIYVGSYFYVVGRYQNAETSILNLTGQDYFGTVQLNFQLDFTDSTNINKFSEKLWAKEMIDELEQTILIYGETSELKDSVIALSLDYEIRCMYTSYFADYENIYVSTDPLLQEPPHKTKSYIYNNFPNPFQNQTTIRFYVHNDDANKYKVIKIYNLWGQLVAILNIADYNEGWHEFVFDGRDHNGNKLAPGIYLVQLQIENQIQNTIRINVN